MLIQQVRSERVVLLCLKEISPVDLGDLLIERPEIVDIAKEKQTTGEEIDQTGDPFAKIKPVDAEDAQEGEQDPGGIVIDISGGIVQIRVPSQGGDQKQINDPADEKEAEGKKINGAAERSAEIKAVRPHESENPQDIANRLMVCVCLCLQRLDLLRECFF